MIVGDGLLNNLPNAEGGVARGVEISRRLVKGSLSGSPGLDIRHLNE
jgi:hypothetical protein